MKLMMVNSLLWNESCCYPQLSKDNMNYDNIIIISLVWLDAFPSSSLLNRTKSMWSWGQLQTLSMLFLFSLSSTTAAQCYWKKYDCKHMSAIYLMHSLTEGLVFYLTVITLQTSCRNCTNRPCSWKSGFIRITAWGMCVPRVLEFIFIYDY